MFSASVPLLKNTCKNGDTFNNAASPVFVRFMVKVTVSAVVAVEGETDNERTTCPTSMLRVVVVVVSGVRFAATRNA